LCPNCFAGKAGIQENNFAAFGLGHGFAVKSQVNDIKLNYFAHQTYL
jgi:hypothetical protein